MKRRLRSLRHRVNVMRRLDLSFVPELQVPTEFHGTGYGGFGILRDSLGPTSVVLSGGIGEDVSFDLSVIAKYGCVVYAFDPTPKSVAWVRAHVAEPRFVFEPFAISDDDGLLQLFLPRNPAHVSASMRSGRHTSREAIQVPAKRLSTIVRERGLERIDLLKLDIEGAEYAVLDDFLTDASILPEQLALEFHHFYPEFGLAATQRTVHQLRSRGYRLCWVSPSHHELLFAIR